LDILLGTKLLAMMDANTRQATPMHLQLLSSSSKWDMSMLIMVRRADRDVGRPRKWDA
jgi:hypothetical protein